MNGYRAPRWLIGGNSQTIWPALFSSRGQPRPPVFRRERWDTPDGDFIDVDWLDAAAHGADDAADRQPLLVLFHGLEGCSQSHYAVSFAHCARELGWDYAVPHFRGCSGELNRAPRAYHSGDFEEIGWVMARMRARHAGPVFAVGISLGGNALMRWVEEAGSTARGVVGAVCAISAPLDLAAGGWAIGQGFNRQVYTRMFMRTMRAKALAKWEQHRGLFDRGRMLAARTIFEFDNIFTAPLHGFADTPDYWARASAKPHLHHVALPALILNARNDPFVPASSLPRPQDVSSSVTLWQPPHGGHVGFASGRWPGTLAGLPQQVLHWLRGQL